MAFPYRLISTSTKIPFLKYRLYAVIISIILTIATVTHLCTNGLNFGIDLTGGTLIEFPLPNDISKIYSAGEISDKTRIVLTTLGYKNATVQQQTSGSYSRTVIRFPILQQQDTAVILENINSALTAEFGTAIQFDRVDFVGPKIGKDFAHNAIKALALALLVMMLYTWIRFDYRFACGVLIALLHDVVMVTGFYSWSRYEFDITSLGALLTVIGYSINDSIVIYDRIRENIKKTKSSDHKYSVIMGPIIDLSINETLSRTIMTVATTLVVSIILAIFGGDGLRGFGLAISFGIAFGTYSSIFISGPILMDLDRLFSHIKPSNQTGDNTQQT